MPTLNLRRLVFAALLLATAGTHSASASVTDPATSNPNPAPAAPGAATPQSSAVTWGTDVVAAYIRAMREQKPLVIYFYSSQTVDNTGKCKYCTKLEQEVLFTEAFGALANDAVYVMVDVAATNSADVTRMIEQLGVKNVPCVAVLDSRIDVMEEVGRVTGSLSFNEFLGQFVKLLRDWDRAHARAAQAAGRRI